MTDGKVDDALWRLHLETVAMAQAHRVEMVKVAVEATKGILESMKLI